MPKRIARWNPARDAWETETTGLFCEHSDVYSETWPTSGTTRGGTAYELPMSGRLTDDSGSSSLLPTPAAMNPNDGESVETWEARRQRVMLTADNGNGFGTPLAIAVQLLPTPVADHSRGLPQPGTDYASLPNAVIGLLPTPTAMDYKASGGNSTSNVTLTDAVVRTRLGASTNPRFDVGNDDSAA